MISIFHLLQIRPFVRRAVLILLEMQEDPQVQSIREAVRDRRLQESPRKVQEFWEMVSPVVGGEGDSVLELQDRDVLGGA